MPTGRQLPPGSAPRAVALRAAQRGIILLKNDGALPLALPAAGKARPKIAIIDTGVVRISIREAVRARTKGRAEILVPAAKVPAIDVAKRADRIILVSAENAGGAPQDLLDALKALGKPLVVVIASDRPSVSLQLAEQANALVAAWCLGEDGGKAVADVLFGDVNPGGKLPVTIARNAGQLPLFYNAKPSARRGYLFDTTRAALSVRLGPVVFDVRARRAAPVGSGHRPRTDPSKCPWTCATAASSRATRPCSSTSATR